MASRALVAGVTGLIGSNQAEHLVSRGWEVHGVARRPPTGIPGVRPVAADLLEPAALRSALAGIDPTHVFFTTWVRRASEEENIAANGALVRNLLGALEPSGSLRHAALVTGLKHYLGPFEFYAKVKPDTPLREEMQRLPFPNPEGRPAPSRPGGRPRQGGSASASTSDQSLSHCLRSSFGSLARASRSRTPARSPSAFQCRSRCRA
jgi:nucleoside-diphosphate-sugar epimerase